MINGYASGNGQRPRGWPSRRTEMINALRVEISRLRPIILLASDQPTTSVAPSGFALGASSHRRAFRRVTA